MNAGVIAHTDWSGDSAGKEIAADNPRIRALRELSVPFLCYSSRGEKLFASRHALELLRADPASGEFEAQAARVAAEALRHPVDPSGRSAFLCVHEVPSVCGTAVIAVHLARSVTEEPAVVVVLRPHARSIDDEHPLLTARELQVARLIATGLATKEIARQLRISPHTARHHTERIFAKLGVRSRAAVARCMVRA